MDSGGGGERKALMESGGNHRHQQYPLEQSSGHDDDHHQNHLHNISTKIIVRKTISYLIALAFACFLLYHSSNHIDHNFPISYRPLSQQSQTTTQSSSQSCSSSDQANSSGSVVGNSATSIKENLPSHTSSSAPQAQENIPSSPASDHEETEEAKLEKVLNKAAMGNKTVIVTTVNAAWTEPDSLFDLFLESLKNGIGTQKFLNHLVVIALDQKSYNRCSELHPHCYSLKTEWIDFSEHEAYFMRSDYINLVWRKIEFMHTILKLGYNSLFTDADVMWFRDPFLHFMEDADMQTASDHYGGTPTNGSSSTGFYYVKSNDRTIQFFELWLKSRQGRRHDQHVFDALKNDPSVMEKIGIKIRVLDTDFYGGFCEPSEDLNLVCTMHANCCLGLRTKVRDIKLVLEDWKNYLAILPAEDRTKTPRPWTLALRRKCHG